MASGSQYQKALAYLENLVAACRKSGLRRLPRTREMAAGAGVCEMTLRKALATLRQRGAVHVSHGRGTTVAFDDVLSPRAEPLRSRWGSIRDRLYADIISGTLGGPSVHLQPKELRSRYGTAHTTLNKALGDLVHTGIVEPWQRGYRVRETAGGRNVSIGVVLRGIDYGDVVTLSDLQHRQIRFVQKYCRQRSVNVDIVPVRYVGDSIQGIQDLQQLIRSTPALAGVLILGRGIPPQTIEEACGLAVSQGKSVAILADDPFTGTVQRFGDSLCCIESPSCSTVPGERMADFLLERGHRSAVYVCDTENALWSRVRFEGLRERFARVDGTVFSCHITVRGLEFDAEAAIDKALPSRIKNAIPPHLSRVSQRTLSWASLGNYVNLISLQKGVDKALEQALNQHHPSVLIGGSDRVALCCLNFLHSRDKTVPGEYSVVGFDNEVEGMSRELTSYDFDVEGSLSRLLHFVLLPKEVRRGRSIDTGYVVERASSGRKVR